MSHPAQPPSFSLKEAQDAEQVDAALRLLVSKDLAGAERLLTDVVSRAPRDPRDYVHSYEQDGSLHIKFWSVEEFAYYATRNQEEFQQRKQQIVWMKNAYPRAFFYLGFVREAQGDHEGAIRWLDEGMKLEPGHPSFRLELARAWSGLKQYERALALYTEVEEMGEEISADTRAIALRGKGFQLIEMGHLDHAERCFLDSLKLEPGNDIALNELEYIQHLREGGQKMGSELTTNGGEKALCCAQCGGDLDGGSMFNDEGRVICFCKQCVEAAEEIIRQENAARTQPPKKKWWQFWS
ncbi:tetratricopeptide repeat protein [Archangium violaceum]|uniref:tetratricopeptide repeat protein n=1 Tax=Archangium violaceum TaxID=83451 RepID=UPI002B3203B3|nr:tetratricopeptide repeat protein [Archangium violaceum]